jgi:hypothetical protein
VNPNDTASIKAALEALEKANAGAEVNLPDGSRARVEEGVGGVRGVNIIRPDGNNWHLRVFPAVDTRPAAFDDRLPFVPNTKASLLETADGHMLATWEAPDADPVFEQVMSQSTQAGWQSDGSSPNLMVPMQLVQLKRGERTRVVMRMKVNQTGIVSMFDS